MPESNAWLIKLTEKETIAIGENELLHIITEPDLYKIPKVKKYCQHVIKWKNQVLPVMNITGLLYNQDIGISGIVGIIAYKHNESNTINYAAIDLTSVPKKISVNDKDACELPEPLHKWKPFSAVCFKKNNNVIPIISLQKVFS